MIKMTFRAENNGIDLHNDITGKKTEQFSRQSSSEFLMLQHTDFCFIVIILKLQTK